MARRSSAAVSAGAPSAGRNLAARNSAVVASAEPVWSSTRMARATTPRLSPSSLSAYDAASGANPGTRSEVRMDGTRRNLVIASAKRPLPRRKTRDMPMFRLMARRALWAFHGLLLAGSLLAAVLGSRAEDWHPVGL